MGACATQTEKLSFVVDLPVSLGLRFAIVLSLLMGLLIGVTFAIGSLLFGAVGGPTLSGVMAGLVGVLTLWVLAPLLAKSRFRRYLAHARTHFSEVNALFEALREVLVPYGQTPLAMGGRNNLLRIVADKLLAAGERGAIFRLTSAPAAAPPLPAPLTVPMEPTPLRDASESFIDLRGARVTFGQRARHWWTMFQQLFQRRRWAWFVLLACILFGFASLIVQAIWALSSLMRGHISQEFWITALVFPILAGQYLWWTLRPDRWFLVPGGLIVIDPRWLGKAGRVRLIRREQAVLLYWMQGGQAVIASPNERPVQRRLSPWEFEMLASAWRSPLPSPPEEQVRALLE